MNNSSYSKIPAGKKPQTKEPFTWLKTREEKSERLVSVLERLHSEWLPFVKKVTADPAIPIPFLVLDPLLSSMAPNCFKWTTKDNKGVFVLFNYETEHMQMTLDAAKVPYEPTTAEEAYQAVRAVFVPAKAK